MTKVVMLQRITGYRDGVEWPEAGQEIELPAWEAENLIVSGAARLVEVPEAAAVTVETPEDGGVSDGVPAAGDAVVEPGEGTPPVSSPAPAKPRAKRGK